MSGIFGHLTVDDRDRVFAATVGQRVIWETAMQWVADRNAELASLVEIFVAQLTEDYKFRFKLPAAGYLQERGPDGRYRSVKAEGQWDVALPLYDFGAQVSSNDVDMAYMRIEDLDRHLRTVVSQNVATVRYQILKAMFDNTQETFVDPDWGNLSVEPLANGDSVVYPPLAGTDSEATEDHYLESGYTAANISDTNNPYITIRDELIHHWGEGIEPGGTDIVVFINSANRAKTEALTDWVPITDRFLQLGDDTTRLRGGIPRGFPGELIGRTNGVWVVQWSWMPSGYMIGIDPTVEAPLYQRRDPADTGLPIGLSLVSEDEEFPFKGSFWRNRFGYGCVNRLNGVVMEISDGGTYTIPTAYQ